jgi:hypothetical protein
VSDTHCVLWHAVSPILAAAEIPVECAPKLKPESVTLADPLCGSFITSAYVTTGESYVNAESFVPETDAMTTDIVASAPYPPSVLHCTCVFASHEAVPQIVEPTFMVAV